MNAATDTLLKFPQKSQDEKDKLWAENGQILYYLQISLTNASLARLNFSSRPLHLHQVLICGTYMLLQLREFWDSLWNKLLDKGPYVANIGGMRLRLHKLQTKDKQAWKLRANQQLGQQGWEDIDRVLHHQSFFYMLEIIRTELISRYHDDPLAGHFGIEKT